MHTTVRFILAGRIEEISHCDPTLTVLDYLRESKALRGTKEGCAEGDCGACTVVVGELRGDGIRYQAVNACIQFLATLDGKLLLTVEDLCEPHGELHEIQRAMVAQHGSQCGFCTPGFIMSLLAMFLDDPDNAKTRSDIESGLAGNLCRCTGYAPIVRAAEQVLTAHRQDRFIAERKQRLEQLQAIQTVESLQIVCGERHFYAPRSMATLCTLLEQHPNAVMIAGATDVGLWVTKQLRELESVIYLGAVEELGAIDSADDWLSIGAAVSYTDAKEAITVLYPGFMPLIERIGATQVRNAGTIGGNIANGSPIGDMPPGLIVAGARLTLRSAHGQRTIDLEDYFIGYGKQDLRAGECVEQILLPLPSAQQIFATYKISKRFEQDISSVCAAFSLQVNDGLIMAARVCFGGMAETPKRATTCEQVLSGNTWCQETIECAMAAIVEDFTPITDVRASADYRMRVAQNLLQRFYLENTSNTFPVRLGSRFVPVIADV